MKYERPDTSQKNILLFKKTKIRAIEATKISYQVTWVTGLWGVIKQQQDACFFPIIVQVGFPLVEI